VARIDPMSWAVPSLRQQRAGKVGIKDGRG
jgi:hypothetical protein